MDLQDILVFADGSLNGIARARMSASFASEHEAHVDFYVVAELPPRPYGEGAVPLMEMTEQARQVAREDAGKAVAAMRKSLPRERFDIQSIEATASEVAKVGRDAGSRRGSRHCRAANRRGPVSSGHRDSERRFVRKRTPVSGHPSLE